MRYVAPMAEYVDPRQVVVGIRALLGYFNGKSRCMLPSTKGLKYSMRILGVWLQPPNRFGVRDWLLGRQWRTRLSVAGIDPERIELVDESKLSDAIIRVQDRQAQQKREKAQRREREGVRMRQGHLDQNVMKPQQTSPGAAYVTGRREGSSYLGSTLLNPPGDQSDDSLSADPEPYWEHRVDSCLNTVPTKEARRRAVPRKQDPPEDGVLMTEEEFNSISFLAQGAENGRPAD